MNTPANDMTAYTVILRHPDWMGQSDWGGTALSHEFAAYPEDAFGLAQDRQSNEHGGKPEDWAVVAIFEGHLQDLHTP